MIQPDHLELALSLLSQRAPRIGRLGALFLAIVLGIHAGVMPRIAAAATNDGQAQTDNSQTYTRPYFGYPPNSYNPKYFKEEEKAIRAVESAFGRYSSACIALFRPELIGLNGKIDMPVETAEERRLKGPEGLLNPYSLAGAISEASVLMSQSDSELTEWQRQIKRELKTPLPDYWSMPPNELSGAAKETEKGYAQAVVHATSSDAPSHTLHAFVLARQVYAIRLAELWRRPETQKDPRILDYVRSLLSDGKPGNFAHMPQEIPDSGSPVAFVLFTPAGDAVMEHSSLDTPSKSGNKNDRRQRHLAIRIEVVIASRKVATFEFVRYYVFKRVPDDYTPKDGPPFADLDFADYRWVMPPSTDDRVTWSAGGASIKKNDTFPFQDDMVMRFAPDDPYLSRNYREGGPLGPAKPGEPPITLAELVRHVEAVAAREGKHSGSSPAHASKPAPPVTKALQLSPAVAPPPVRSAPTPVPVVATPVPAKYASGINPMFTTDTQFTIPGTSPIGKELTDNATENVNKAVQWLNPLIRDAKGPWAELLILQPRDAASGIIGIHFSVSPAPPSPSAAPQLIMSKAPSSLSIGIPAEHYQDAGAIFEDVLELFISNIPQQNRAAHDKQVQEIKKSAGEFSYPGDPLPPEVLAKLGVGTSSQAKSLDPDTPDTGTSTGIYDGDIQGRVIGSTVKCFNFLFSKGAPYLTKLQNAALQKAKERSVAGDAERAKYWQEVATILGEDTRTINSLLEPLPHQLKVEFYFRPAEPTTTRGKPPTPKIPESEPGVRMVIALNKEAYEQGPGAVKDALIQELSNEVGGIPIRRAVDDFFLLFGDDPANKGNYFAVTMQQLHPQPDEATEVLSKLWPTRASEQAVASISRPAASVSPQVSAADKPAQPAAPASGGSSATQNSVQAALPAEQPKAAVSAVKSFKPDFSRVDEFPAMTDVKQQAPAISFTNWLERYLNEAVVYLTEQKKTLEAASRQSWTSDQSVEASKLRHDQLQKALDQISKDIDAATRLLKSLPQDTVVHFYMYDGGAERMTSRLDGSTQHIFVGAKAEDYNVVPASLKLELPGLMLRMISVLCSLTSGNDEQLVNQSVRQFIDLYASDPAHGDDELVKGLEPQKSSADSIDNTSQLNRPDGMTGEELMHTENKNTPVQYN